VSEFGCGMVVDGRFVERVLVVSDEVVKAFAGEFAHVKV
jgi:hypothetical protein